MPPPVNQECIGQWRLGEVIRLQLVVCFAICAFAEEPHLLVKSNTREMEVSVFRAESHDDWLKRMNEPNLAEEARDASTVAYRMMILATWGNNFIVRVEKKGGSY